VFLGLVGVIVAGCATPGSLTGGEKDEKPPVLLKSEPANYSVNFKATKALLEFDEYFELRGIGQKLVISPPTDKKPEMKIRGKELEIIFKDSLQPNRTYALNFGDALVDLNEANPLKNFQYVFSTGTEIDSLQVSGKVVQALDDKPVDDVIVMLYAKNEDSLPLKEIPVYISRTDKEGKYSLKNLAAGEYKIFALKDANNNMLFDQPTEGIAFMDSLIRPAVEPVGQPDTAMPADSVKAPVKYKFVPDSLNLRLFTDARPNQYISGTERPRPELVKFRMNEKLDSVDLEFLDLPTDSMPVLLEWSGDPDSLDIWFTHADVAARDSLIAFITFRAYDSIDQPYAKTDTIRFKYRKQPKSDKAPKNEFIMTIPAEKNKSLDPGQPLTIELALPYSVADTSKIRLTTGKDSTARRVEYRIVPDTLRGLVLNGQPVIQPHPRKLTVSAVFLPDSSYRLQMLKGAFSGFGGQLTDSTDFTFKVKKPDEFGSIRLNITELKQPVFVELLGAQNKVLATKRLAGPGEVVFSTLAAGKYNARLVLDTNANGVWDSGRYLKHRQPEEILVYPKDLTVKANWEVSETWQINR